MKKVLVSVLVLAAVGCASGNKTPKMSAVPAEKKFSGPIALQTAIPFGAGAAAENIKSECPEIATKLSDFTKETGAELGVVFNQTAKVDTKAKGAVLVMEFTNVHSSGNAFMGHNKSATVKAQLYKDGQLVDTAERTRSSGGGIGGGFKGSCSVLGRTVKALGSDVATWAKAYQM